MSELDLAQTNNKTPLSLVSSEQNLDTRYYLGLFILASITIGVFWILMETVFPKMLYFWQFRALGLSGCLLGAWLCYKEKVRQVRWVIDGLIAMFISEVFLLNVLAPASVMDLFCLLTVASATMVVTQAKRLKWTLLYTAFWTQIYLAVHWGKPEAFIFYASSMVFLSFAAFGVLYREKLYKVSLEIQREKERIETELTLSRHLSVLGEMTSGIAHEINNPLNVLTAKIYKLRSINEKEVHSELFTPHLDRMDDVVNRIINIVQGMRLLSRSSLEELESAYSVVELNKTLKDVVDLCNYKFMSKEVRLDVEGLENEAKLYCIESHIGQVVMNLLYNALDAVAGTEDPWVRLQFEVSESFYFIHVIDSGLGIPPEVQEKIMKAFYTTKKQREGLGLGLSLIQRMLRIHEGSVCIHPESKNTHFMIKLPRVEEGMRSAA